MLWCLMRSKSMIYSTKYINVGLIFSTYVAQITVMNGYLQRKTLRYTMIFFECMSNFLT